jgi:hypothetical protein
MAGVFVTQAKARPKLAGRAAFRAALRGEDASALQAAISAFKGCAQYSESELVAPFFPERGPRQLREGGQRRVCHGPRREWRRSEQRRIRPPLRQRTPLQWALMAGAEDAAEALVRAGADVDLGTPPPVTIAAAMGRLRSLNLLIERNADLTAEVRALRAGHRSARAPDVPTSLPMSRNRFSDCP